MHVYRARFLTVFLPESRHQGKGPGLCCHTQLGSAWSGPALAAWPGPCLRRPLLVLEGSRLMEGSASPLGVEGAWPHGWVGLAGP